MKLLLLLVAELCALEEEIKPHEFTFRTTIRPVFTFTRRRADCRKAVVCVLQKQGKNKSSYVS